MLRLHYSPGACSLVAHIALEEAGADFELERVDFAKGGNRSQDYLAINPQGKVPALVTDDGPITENVAIASYVGDRFNKPGSIPIEDPLARARATQLMGWCASTVHISFALIFRPQRFAPGHVNAVRQAGQKRLAAHFARIEAMTGEADGWLVGDEFSAPDTYMAVFYRWAKRIGFNLDPCTNWASHVERVLKRKAVKAALKAEGLKADEFRP